MNKQEARRMCGNLLLAGSTQPSAEEGHKSRRGGGSGGVNVRGGDLSLGLGKPKKRDQKPSALLPEEVTVSQGTGGGRRPTGGAWPLPKEPQLRPAPEAEAMRIRMMSAAFVLVLLFLPSENGSPLELPRGAAPQFALVPGPTWELWPRRPGLGAKPPLPSAGTEAGLPSLHRLLGPCEAGGAESTPELRRKERSPYSSRRKDGRPNSLDLTFHLLREFLEMSREERLAQKALSNQMLLQNIGK
ncbi:unnamed protein product [Caretta caretta]